MTDVLDLTERMTSGGGSTERLMKTIPKKECGQKSECQGLTENHEFVCLFVCVCKKATGAGLNDRTSLDVEFEKGKINGVEEKRIEKEKKNEERIVSKSRCT